MAYPSSQFNTDDNPQTRCSTCQTVFEVSRELLDSSDTRVRCGECLSIFDALEGLRSSEELLSDDAAMPRGAAQAFHDAPNASVGSTSPASTLSGPSAAALAGLANDTSALDVTYSDFDLFSEEADLPEIAYFDQTRDTPEFDFDSVEIGDDETFSDTLFVHDVTIDVDSTKASDKSGAESKSGSFAEVDFIGQEEPKEPLIFNYRDPEPEPDGEGVDDALAGAPYAEEDVLIDTSHTLDGVLIDEVKPRSAWWFKGSMFLLLLAILGGLYFVRAQDVLLQNTAIRSAMIKACTYLPCSVDPLVDISAITALKQNVSSHPNVPNALKVIIKFRNDAEFAQAYPVIVMRLFNNLGSVVAKRDFLPDEYKSDWQPGLSIDPQEIIVVTLDINDPGSNAGSFDFKFRAQ